MYGFGWKKRRTAVIKENSVLKVRCKEVEDGKEGDKGRSPFAFNISSYWPDLNKWFV